GCVPPSTSQLGSMRTPGQDRTSSRSASQANALAVALQGLRSASDVATGVDTDARAQPGRPLGRRRQRTPWPWRCRAGAQAPPLEQPHCPLLPYAGSYELIRAVQEHRAGRTVPVGGHERRQAVVDQASALALHLRAVVTEQARCVHLERPSPPRELVGEARV